MLRDCLVAGVEEEQTNRVDLVRSDLGFEIGWVRDIYAINVDVEVL